MAFMLGSGEKGSRGAIDALGALKPVYRGGASARKQSSPRATARHSSGVGTRAGSSPASPTKNT